MPSPLPRQVRWNRFAQYCSIDFGLPQITDRSAPALSVSWPAQRSLTLRPTDSPSRLTRPSTPEAPTALLSPPPLRLLPGGAIQFPGGPFIPLWTSAFHGAPQTPDCINRQRSIVAPLGNPCDASRICERPISRLEIVPGLVCVQTVGNRSVMSLQ